MQPKIQTKNDLRILTVSRSTIPETGYEVTLDDSVIPAGVPSPADDFRETFDIVSHRIILWLFSSITFDLWLGA